MRVSVVAPAGFLLGSLFLLFLPLAIHAQTAAQNQLRATIAAEIASDPRAQTMTQSQIYALVNLLTLGAQKQGITTSQLTYRPQTQTLAESSPAFVPCTDISCSLGRAFGLDGSIPIIPIALFVAAALFILIYGIMREMGHPHTKAY